MEKLKSFVAGLNKKHGANFARVSKPDKFGDVYVTFGGFDGSYDKEEGDIDLTTNVAPDNLQSVDSFDELQLELGNHIKYITELKELTEKLKEHITEVEGDFYWSESDLNIRITITLP